MLVWLYNYNPSAVYTAEEGELTFDPEDIITDIEQIGEGSGEGLFAFLYSRSQLAPH